MGLSFAQNTFFSPPAGWLVIFNASHGRISSHQARYGVDRRIYTLCAWGNKARSVANAGITRKQTVPEWSGMYNLKAGSYALRTTAGPDPTMKALLLPLPDAHIDEESLCQAELLFGDVALAGAWQPGRLCVLDVADAHVAHEVDFGCGGLYALFLEHHLDEFEVELLHRKVPLVPGTTAEYKPDHDHDDALTSVWITTPGDLDPECLNSNPNPAELNESFKTCLI